jgi:EpsI family protein
MIKPLVVLAVLGTNFYVYQWFARDQLIPRREDFAGFPLVLEDWRCAGPETMDEKTLENLGASDYLICDYRRAGEPPVSVVVYVGYHETQVRDEGGGAGENSIHPPKHCLPGSGWDIIGQEIVEVDLPGLPERPARVNRLVIAKGEARQLVYYWYQTQGRVIAEDWRKIVYLSWDRARRQRTDGALVRFTTAIHQKDDAAAEQQLLSLAGAMMPLLPAYVPE